MCGIFGYIGQQNGIPIVIRGIRSLEYRGYDSAGLAAVSHGALEVRKVGGKISFLEKLIEENPVEAPIVIAQTRWATHGKPSKENAHPHTDSDNTLALVHNGIIENYVLLKSQLQKEGNRFDSETDTEVIAHLLARFYEGDLLQAVCKTMEILEGSYAIALLHKDHPDKIVAFAHHSPLAIGIGKGEAYVSSDSNAFASLTDQVVYLAHNEIAFVGREEQQFFSSSGEPLDKKASHLHLAEALDTSKGDFSHFTLKEIFQQPLTIRQALEKRFDAEKGTSLFSEFDKKTYDFQRIQRILIVACGTSYHAGLVASYFFEDWTGIPTQVEIASEYRYKKRIIPSNTLVIAISQSGETADTLAAVRALKEKGATIFSLCNVLHSTLARESDYCIPLRAGPEIGVASTKAFTSQLTVLFLFGLFLGRMRDIGQIEGQQFIQNFLALPELTQEILALSPDIQRIAEQASHYKNYFFIGRSYMFPAALEAALKLKEISYLNATGYPAGEMKHGPIALIDPSCLTVALCTNEALFDKLWSNVMEVKARQGPLLAVVFQGEERFNEVADFIISFPKTTDELAAILASIALQLFAFYCALSRGEDIDQPRNLAKSVTVE